MSVSLKCTWTILLLIQATIVNSYSGWKNVAHSNEAVLHPNNPIQEYPYFRGAHPENTSYYAANQEHVGPPLGYNNGFDFSVPSAIWPETYDFIPSTVSYEPYVQERGYDPLMFVENGFKNPLVMDVGSISTNIPPYNNIIENDRTLTSLEKQPYNGNILSPLFPEVHESHPGSVTPMYLEDYLPYPNPTASTSTQPSMNNMHHNDLDTIKNYRSIPTEPPTLNRQTRVPYTVTDTYSIPPTDKNAEPMIHDLANILKSLGKSPILTTELPTLAPTEQPESMFDLAAFLKTIPWKISFDTEAPNILSSGSSFIPSGLPEPSTEMLNPGEDQRLNVIPINDSIGILHYYPETGAKATTEDQENHPVFINTNLQPTKQNNHKTEIENTQMPLMNKYNKSFKANDYFPHSFDENPYNHPLPTTIPLGREILNGVNNQPFQDERISQEKYLFGDDLDSNNHKDAINNNFISNPAIINGKPIRNEMVYTSDEIPHVKDSQNHFPLQNANLPDKFSGPFDPKEYSRFNPDGFQSQGRNINKRLNSAVETTNIPNQSYSPDSSSKINHTAFNPNNGISHPIPNSVFPEISNKNIDNHSSNDITNYDKIDDMTISKRNSFENISPTNINKMPLEQSGVVMPLNGYSQTITNGKYFQQDLNSKENLVKNTQMGNHVSIPFDQYNLDNGYSILDSSTNADSEEIQEPYLKERTPAYQIENYSNYDRGNERNTAKDKIPNRYNSDSNVKQKKHDQRESIDKNLSRNELDNYKYLQEGHLSSNVENQYNDKQHYIYSDNEYQNENKHSPAYESINSYNENINEMKPPSKHSEMPPNYNNQIYDYTKFSNNYALSKNNNNIIKETLNSINNINPNERFTHDYKEKDLVKRNQFDDFNILYDVLDPNYFQPSENKESPKQEPPADLSKHHTRPRHHNKHEHHPQKNTKEDITDLRPEHKDVKVDDHENNNETNKPLQDSILLRKLTNKQNDENSNEKYDSEPTKDNNDKRSMYDLNEDHHPFVTTDEIRSQHPFGKNKHNDGTKTNLSTGDSNKPEYTANKDEDTANNAQKYPPKQQKEPNSRVHTTNNNDKTVNNVQQYYDLSLLEDELLNQRKEDEVNSNGAENLTRNHSCESCAHKQGKREDQQNQFKSDREATTSSLLENDEHNKNEHHSQNDDINDSSHTKPKKKRPCKKKKHKNSSADGDKHENKQKHDGSVPDSSPTHHKQEHAPTGAHCNAPERHHEDSYQAERVQPSNRETFVHNMDHTPSQGYMHDGGKPLNEGIQKTNVDNFENVPDIACHKKPPSRTHECQTCEQVRHPLVSSDKVDHKQASHCHMHGNSQTPIYEDLQKTNFEHSSGIASSNSPFRTHDYESCHPSLASPTNYDSSNNYTPQPFTINTPGLSIKEKTSSTKSESASFGDIESLTPENSASISLSTKASISRHELGVLSPNCEITTILPMHHTDNVSYTLPNITHTIPISPDFAIINSSIIHNSSGPITITKTVSLGHPVIGIHITPGHSPVNITVSENETSPITVMEIVSCAAHVITYGTTVTITPPVLSTTINTSFGHQNETEPLEIVITRNETDCH